MTGQSAKRSDQSFELLEFEELGRDAKAVVLAVVGFAAGS